MGSKIFGQKVAIVAAGMAILGFAAVFAQPAVAGCLDYKAPKKVSWQSPADFRDSLRIVKVSDEESSRWEWEPSNGRAPIVGLWAFKYISKGNLKTLGIPDGAILDGGNTLWYADGNENTVSGVRAPATGDVCLGIWQRTGEYTYELNHIGLSWDTVHDVPGGPAFIKQYIVLARDKQSYTGSVTIRQLEADGKTLATPAPIHGEIVATRVRIDTATQEALP
jgi:hypothetical protein